MFVLWIKPIFAHATTSRLKPHGHVLMSNDSTTPPNSLFIGPIVLIVNLPQDGHFCRFASAGNLFFARTLSTLAAIN